MPRNTMIPYKENNLRILSEPSYDNYNETATKKKFTLYFTNWGIYARGCPPSKLPIDKIPEISYAFFNVNADGTLASGDEWADFNKRFVTADEGVAPSGVGLGQSIFRQQFFLKIESHL